MDITLDLPSSKSLANRVLILAAQTEGSFFVSGDFEAEDVQIMINSLHKLGISIIKTEKGLHVENNLSWKKDDGDLELYLGNSGTSTRFLSSLVPLRKGNTVLTGNDRMKERPISDMSDALVQLGVKVTYLENDGFPPVSYSLQEQNSPVVTIRGDVSSQYLSSLLLSAASYPLGMNISIEGALISRPYIELTLDLMKKWGIDVTLLPNGYSIAPQKHVAKDYEIEGDASAAVYWWAFEFLHGNSVTFSNLEESSVQGDMKFRNVLSDLNNHNEGVFERDMNDLPDASLMLMALSPLLEFPIKITNIASLRVKETDRIEAMKNELLKLGVKVETGEDWISIDGTELSSLPESVQIETYDDHRIAMCFAVLGSKIGNLEILDPDCVKKTYPKFWVHLKMFS